MLGIIFKLNIIENSNKIKWLMSILFLLSAIIIGLNTSISKIGFLLFLFAHLIGILLFSVLKDRPMIFQNLLFAFVDIFSIYRWFS
jgi:hypothetical protein